MTISPGTILFDFDGTLADTEDSMRESLNSLADEFGFRPIASTEKLVLGRMGAREFLSRRLGIPLWKSIKIRRLIRKARRSFATRVAGVRLFPGAAELVASLHAAGYRIGIVSTNTEAVIRRVLGELKDAIDFVRIGSVMIGKSRPIRRILREGHLDPAAVVYVSDEVRDADMCRRVGIPMIGVAWGLNDAESLRAHGVAVATTWADLQAKLAAQLSQNVPAPAAGRAPSFRARRAERASRRRRERAGPGKPS